MTADPDLSPAGRERRDHIERLAVRAAGRRRARRQARRVALGLVVVAVLGGRWWSAMVHRGKPERSGPATPHRLLAKVPRPINAMPISPPAGVTITFVATDPAIVERLRADPGGPPRWTTIGDRELLDALAAAGRPAGLVRTADGRAVLVEP